MSIRHPVSLSMPMRRTKISGSALKWKTVSLLPRKNLLEVNCIEDKVNGDPSTGLFCIFDGHGGKQVSEYCAERFAIELKAQL